MSTNALDAAIANLTAELTANTDAETSAETLLAQLFKMLQDALAAPIATSEKLAAIQDIVDRGNAAAAQLAAAVIANTPAAPGPTTPTLGIASSAVHPKH